MDNNLIGIKIKEVRKKQNLTQQQLADLVGVSNKAVSKWENGEGIPDIANLKRLASIFNISLDELVSNKPLETKVSPLNWWLVGVHVTTLYLFFLPFLKVNPFDSSNEFFINLSGFNLLKEGFINFKVANILIGISLIIIATNALIQIYKIFKKDIASLHSAIPIVSILASLIVLVIIFILSKDQILYVAITLVPGFMVLFQGVQLILFMQLKRAKNTNQTIKTL